MNEVNEINEEEPEVEWKRDHIITRPLNEIDYLVRDNRSEIKCIHKKKIIEFGWEGAD